MTGCGIGLLYTKKHSLSFPVTEINGQYDNVYTKTVATHKNYFTKKEDASKLYVMDAISDFSLYYDGQTNNYQFHFNDIEHYQLRESKFNPDVFKNKIQVGNEPFYWSIYDGRLTIDGSSSNEYRSQLLLSPNNNNLFYNASSILWICSYSKCLMWNEVNTPSQMINVYMTDQPNNASYMYKPNTVTKFNDNDITVSVSLFIANGVLCILQIMYFFK